MERKGGAAMHMAYVCTAAQLRGAGASRESYVTGSSGRIVDGGAIGLTVLLQTVLLMSHLLAEVETPR